MKYTQQLLATDVTTTGVGIAVRTPTNFIKKAVQATIVGTSGAQTASVNVEVSNDGQTWTVLTTLSLSGTSSDSKVYVVDGPYMYVRGNVTAISGTGAKVNANIAY